MDKFDETMRNIKDLSPDDKKKKMDAFLDKCACPTCPTYTECSKNDLFNIHGRYTDIGRSIARHFYLKH
jgi:hypothetical protein